MFEEPQTSPEPCVLDAVALQRLHELDPDGRHSVVQRVMSAFESSLARMCTVLQGQAQAEAADSDVVAGIAHTLKSSSASVGALGLARACADVEALLRQDPQAELLPQIEKLLAQATAALQAVRAMLRA